MCGTFVNKKAIGLLLLLSGVGLASCVPKDVSLPTATSNSSTSPSYSGFTGATSVQTVSSTKLAVNWTSSTDSSVVAYNIYNAADPFNLQLMKTVMAPASTVTLTGLTAQTKYSLLVRAANAKDIEDGNTNYVYGIPYGGIVSASVTS